GQADCGAQLKEGSVSKRRRRAGVEINTRYRVRFARYHERVIDTHLLDIPEQNDFILYAFLHIAVVESTAIPEFESVVVSYSLKPVVVYEKRRHLHSVVRRGRIIFVFQHGEQPARFG